MFHLTIWTYLLLCAWVAATGWAATRPMGVERYRRAVRIVAGLLVLGTLWLAWALLSPHRHAAATGDFTYESVGCLFACLTGLYGLVICVRARSLAAAMATLGGGWLLMIYSTLIAQA